MLDFFTFIPQVHASSATEVVLSWATLSFKALVSIVWLSLLFLILITEKVDKTLVSILVAGLLIFLQVFTQWDVNWPSSQEIAGQYIYHNLDIFAFIIGMMILSWFTKDSWIFNYLAIKIAKAVKWSPKKLFFIFSYMAFFLTVFISNIPTIIILAPIVTLITKKLDLPSMPYILGIIIFANLGWAVTPISDPTTYYQATNLWFSFWDVFSNTGLIMFTVSLSSSLYLYLLFRKDFNLKPELDEIKDIDPKHFLSDKKELIISTSILFIVILLVVFKEFIFNKTWIRFDNWSITLFWAFLAILFLNRNVGNTLRSQVDYATLFFFAGLFIVVWALEYNWVIEYLANKLIYVTDWSENLLLLMITMWSAILSVFIDNVPYNIAMVSTLHQFLDSWAVAWWAWMALAWWLNSCTSIGWAWSPIWAACNVIALGQAEKNWVIIRFLKYLVIWVPLVFINSFIAFLILYFRYLF